MSDAQVLCQDFVPRSRVPREVGALSVRICEPQWWGVHSFEARVDAMVEWFDRRELVTSTALDAKQRELLAKDMCLVARVNQPMGPMI